MERKEFLTTLKSEIAVYVAERKFVKADSKTVFRDEQLVSRRKSELDIHTPRTLTVNLTPRMMYVIYGLIRGRTRSQIESGYKWETDAPNMYRTPTGELVLVTGQYPNGYKGWWEGLVQRFMEKHGFGEFYRAPWDEPFVKEADFEQIQAIAS